MPRRTFTVQFDPAKRGLTPQMGDLATWHHGAVVCCLTEPQTDGTWGRPTRAPKNIRVFVNGIPSIDGGGATLRQREAEFQAALETLGNQYAPVSVLTAGKPEKKCKRAFILDIDDLLESKGLPIDGSVRGVECTYAEFIARLRHVDPVFRPDNPSKVFFETADLQRAANELAGVKRDEGVGGTRR